jgi:small subunit ribosomal protein S16
LAVRIRLKRFGTIKKPFYRIVVMDVRRSRGGRAVEELGYYDPRAEALKVDEDRARYWLGVGAQPTETARTLLRRVGVLAPAAAREPAARKTEPKAAPVQDKGGAKTAEPATEGSAEEPEEAE